MQIVLQSELWVDAIVVMLYLLVLLFCFVASKARRLRAVKSIALRIALMEISSWWFSQCGIASQYQ
jgi:hypothetical protein